MKRTATVVVVVTVQRTRRTFPEMKRAGLSTDRFEIAAWNSEAERPLFKGLSFREFG